MTLGGLEPEKAGDKTYNYNFLIYSEWGVGKTHLVGTASEVDYLSPVLLIDVEDGAVTLRDTYPNVDVIRITKPSELEAIYRDLRKGDHGYRTVAIDTLTQYQGIVLQKIAADAAEADDKYDPDVPAQRHYKKSQERLFRILRSFRDLPINSIFTAHSKNYYDEDKRKNFVQLGFTNQVSQQIGVFFHNVLYLYMKEVKGEQKRVLLTQKQDNVNAKTRFHGIPKFIEDPTMGKIFEYIHRSGKETGNDQS